MRPAYPGFPNDQDFQPISTLHDLLHLAYFKPGPAYEPR
jgi:hypothetical protein